MSQDQTKIFKTTRNILVILGFAFIAVGIYTLMVRQQASIKSASICAGLGLGLIMTGKLGPNRVVKFFKKLLTSW